MDFTGSILNENEQTAPVRKKRLSSILKMPRPGHAPGIENEQPLDYQIPVMKKRGSRRVSFSETNSIKVFAKDAAEINKMEDINSTGLNNLLHAPLQVPQSEVSLFKEAPLNEEDNQFLDNSNNLMDVKMDEKTIMFVDNNEDMEMTQSHTVKISERSVQKPVESSSEKLDFKCFLTRMNDKNSNNFQCNETTLFSADNEDMEMTQSHTVNIKEKSVNKAGISSSSAQANFKYFLDSIHENKPNEGPTAQTNYFNSDKTIVFSTGNEDMEITQSHTVNISDRTVRKAGDESLEKLDFRMFLHRMNNNNPKSCLTEQSNNFQCNKTVMFSSDNEDMEMTQSDTANIREKSVKAAESSFAKSDFSSFCSRMNGNNPNASALKQTISNHNKTSVFSAEEEDMEMTQSHTININEKSVRRPTESSTKNSNFDAVCPRRSRVVPREETNDIHYNKTIVFSADNEDMEMTQSHTVNINEKPVRRPTNSSYVKSDFTKVYVNVNGNNSKDDPPEETVFNSDKTIIFSTNNEDMEMTQSHTVDLSNKPMNKAAQSSLKKLDFKQFLARIHENKPVGPTKPTDDFLLDKTVVFSADNEDMEMTESHTINLKAKSLNKSAISSSANSDFKHFHGSVCENKHTESLTAQTNSVHCDKTMVFSADLDDMEMTQSHTVNINDKTMKNVGKSSLGKSDFSLLLTKKNDKNLIAGPAEQTNDFHGNKTIIFSDVDGKDMEMTQSHTANIKDISVRRTLGSSRGETNFKIFDRQHSTDQTSELQCCNTIVFSADNEDMEMTQSHTVNINDKSMRSPAQSSFAKSDLKNIYARMDKNDQTLHPAEQTHDFQSNKTIMFAGDNEDMEITQGNTVNINDKCMRRPVESSLGKSQASTSFMNMDGNISDQSVAGQTLLHPNKTVVFSADNEDMELTKSHTVNINDKHMKRAAESFFATSNVKNLQTQMNDNNSVAGTSGQMSDSQCNKTIVFSAASEDMDLTQSHTVNISDKPVRKTPESSLEKLDFSNLCSRIDGNKPNTGPVEQTVFQGNKTIVFSSDNEAMEMTQSHTININEKSVQIAADSFFTKSNVKNLNTQMNDGNSTVGPSGQMSDSLHNKTIAFSAGNENRALTQSHTVNINEKSVRKAPESSFMKSDFTSSCSNLNENNRSTSPEEQIVLQGPKTIVFSSDNEDMEVSQIHDKSGEKTAEFCLGKLNVNANVNGNCTNGDQTGDSKCSKTIVFSNVNEDLELAQRHSVNINDNSTSKLLKSSFGELDFSNTCSHLKENNPNAGLTEQIVSKCKRTIPISTNNEDMEMTQSHTVNINQKDVKATDLDTKETSCLQKDNAKSTFQKAVTDQERYFSKRKSLGMFLPKLPNKRKLCTSDTTPVNLLHLEGNSTASSQNTNPKGATGSKTFGQCWPHAKISAVPDIKKEVCPDFDLESSSEIHHSDKTQLDCEESEEHLAKTTDLEQPHQMFQSPRTKSLDSTLDSFEVSGEKRFKAGILQESDTGQQSLLDGSITVREFMQLLEVNMDIQKPRQSQLPPNCFSDVTPALDDWLKEKYIYEPQLQVWEEDYQTQSNLIDSLQLEMSSLDKRLIELNEPFWEKIRTYSLGQLNNLGLGITEKNSYFRKEAKMLFNERKMKLYTEMINIAELEEQKLKQKITKCDEVIFGIEQLFASVEDKKNKGISVWAHFKLMLSGLIVRSSARKQLTLESVIKEVKNEIQKQEEVIWKLKSQIEDYQSISVWTISEWLSEKACFRFLEDSFEIEVKFGDPLADILFCEKPAHKIDEVKFYTLLDEGNCKPSYAVVHRLLRQFVHSKCSWNQDCTTQRDLPMLLHEFSLVTTRYHSLGEEIENLITNGSLKYYILNLEIRNTDLKILFSSYISFVKFEVTFCLTHHYPTSSLQIVNFKNYIGETSFAQFEDVVSSVSKGPHHLTRVVDKIYQEFLSKDYKLPLFV
ncbi:kinetochore scaffold 1 [Erpetoichthys calabaricus]|uniref:kinetochore scaffold 1 n=1 Tax=Erpetoichthys calabaricus TaxID=27687 RepID=UPI0022343A78|nr:kinetochore scaffold 1 [Erpetoichthys calabaricus]